MYGIKHFIKSLLKANKTLWSFTLCSFMHYIQNLFNEFHMDGSKPSQYPSGPVYDISESKPLDY